MRIFDGHPRLSSIETAETYSRSRLVLNENLFPALNLRLFEALACGSAVLTEANAPGLNELFIDKTHLIAYSSGDLLDKIDYYLSQEAERENIAFTGAKEIREKHTFHHRAEELIRVLEDIDKNELKAKHIRESAWGRALMGYGLKWGDRMPSALNYASRLLASSLAETPEAETMLAKGKLDLLSGNKAGATDNFLQAGRLKPEDLRPFFYAGLIFSQANDMISAKNFLSKAAEISGMEQISDSYLKVGAAEFHLFWGSALKAVGDSMEAGLMKLHLPMPFWSALEHFRRAGQLKGRHWEAAGDLLMENSAPEAALQAYNKASPKMSSEKIIAARKTSYQSLKKGDAVPLSERMLALCMIVKNEEANLRELLPSIRKAVDQIIVGDTGSSDGSIKTARKLGAEVFSIPWTNDFAAARNRTLDKVRCKYVLYLDADDRIEAKELSGFKKTLRRQENAVFYVKLENNRKGEVCWQKRIFPHRPDLRFQGAIHEQMNADSRKYVFYQAPLTIHHQGYDSPETLQKKAYRNLRIIEAELKKNPDDYYLHYQAAVCRMNLGPDYLAVENLQKAAFSTKALAENPEIVEHSMIMLAKNFQLSGEYRTAIKLLQNLTAVMANSALTHYHLGILLFEEQLYAECRREMEQFFQLGLEVKGIPVAVNKITGWAHYYLGRCYEHQGLLDKAIAEFKHSSHLLENQAKLLIDIARIYLKQGKQAQAKEQLTACLKLNPSARIAQRMLEDMESDSSFTWRGAYNV